MKIKIKFGIITPLFIVFLLFSDNRIYTLLGLFAAALHELGHIAAAKITSIHLNSLSLDLLGARLTTDRRLSSYKDEIILCTAGPLVNFVISATVFLILPYVNKTSAFYEYIRFFATASAALGILNLLPIKSFDGGRILECILCGFSGERPALLTLRILSFISCFSLWCLSVYLIIKTGNSLSLFIFSISLFSRIFINE